MALLVRSSQRKAKLNFKLGKYPGTETLRDPYRSQLEIKSEFNARNIDSLEIADIHMYAFV